MQQRYSFKIPTAVFTDNWLIVQRDRSNTFKIGGSPPLASKQQRAAQGQAHRPQQRMIVETASTNSTSIPKKRPTPATAAAIRNNEQSKERSLSSNTVDD
jgi:hypothetical protein